MPNNNAEHNLREKLEAVLAAQAKQFDKKDKRPTPPPRKPTPPTRPTLDPSDPNIRAAKMRVRVKNANAALGKATGNTNASPSPTTKKKKINGKNISAPRSLSSPSNLPLHAEIHSQGRDRADTLQANSSKKAKKSVLEIIDKKITRLGFRKKI